MSHTLDALASELAVLSQSDLARRRLISSTPCAPHIVCADQALLSFASNDYLGLANDPALIAAAQQAAARWGVGSGSSHLVNGHTSAHEALERALADFTGFAKTLSFSTGYLANLAVMPTLLSRHDAIFADRLNHASLIDGAQLARADVQRYGHLDLTALSRMLSGSSAPRKLIVTDAVFSMDGDIAPLADLLALADTHDALLLVDDAHGFGVLGPQGRGSLAEAGLDSPRLILMGTLGKAAGVAGAFVAGCATVIDWLLQRARPYIFTTAAPPMLAQTLVEALSIIEQGDHLRAHLQALIDRLQHRLQLQHFSLLPSRTAIQPVMIGDNDLALRVAAALRQQGILVPAIRPPTVPAGTARLRISLSAAHTFDDLDRLINALQTIERELA